ncbi:VWA domain-containing protein [Salininema proteolyticum]|uniref:VWA domain-containing protein n=1 Tax=Salininema proteolyticum TaxID=1607685 RepID=A0ABV8U074_9ACTN
MTDPVFALQADYNANVSPLSTEMAVVLSVSCSAGGGVVGDSSVVIVIDHSPSMAGEKFVAARRAAVAAVETLREDARFAVLAGGEIAVPIYPRTDELSPADAESKAEAMAAIEAMPLGSLTYTGRWLRKAAEVLDTRPGTLGHIILLTDGQTNQEPAPYRRDLAQCRGRFTCDAVGIGVDWSPTQLGELTEAFHGARHFIGDLGDLPGHFEKLSHNSVHRAVESAELRVTTPTAVRLSRVRQMIPNQLDLDAAHSESNRTWTVRLGPWSEETREYLLNFQYPKGTAGARSRLASVAVSSGGERSEAVNVMREVTGDYQFTQLPDSVAYYTAQATIKEETDRATAALERGDAETAQEHYQNAYRTAESHGIGETVAKMGKVVSIDRRTRTVQLDDPEREDAYTFTVDVDTPPPHPGGAGGSRDGSGPAPAPSPRSADDGRADDDRASDGRAADSRTSDGRASGD